MEAGGPLVAFDLQRPDIFIRNNLAQCKGYKGYKDGLQPESLADGKLAGETKSTSVENRN